MTKPTPLYQLLETRLDCTLAQFVAERRAESIRPPASWRAIAAELTETTGLSVTHTALREWFAGQDIKTATEPTPGGTR